MSPRSTGPKTIPDICLLTAREMARRMRARDLSAREALSAHLTQIERVNPKVNAIVTLIADQAMERAGQLDQSLASGNTPGPLHGLPIAHKDLLLTKGVRTTFGSPIFKDFVPTVDSLIVERTRNAGAVMIGKTNVPEFGAGSQTFNEVFGTTLNPYDTSKTCGGSSGGAAVALACRMLPIADGSDLGGSLRNPASFCNVVGFRPSPGRVPVWPAPMAWSTLGVEGPMARTVADLAFFLSAIAGPDPRSPISIDEPGSRFAAPLDRDFRATKIAWCIDFQGLPFEPEVKEIVKAQRRVFESLGCIVEEAEPDFSGADEIFKTLRYWQRYLGALANGAISHKDRLNENIRWELERGEKLTAIEVGQAEMKRTELYHRVRQFMERYEFFVLPVTQVLPFDARQAYPTEIAGTKMDIYIDWMKCCYYISVIGNPAISVPCGFSKTGLPVGLQIVGRHHDDWGILQMAHAFEQARALPSALPGAAL